MEVRDSQIQLAKLIQDSIAAGTHAAFEAPTGLGKSFAALVPAIAAALKGGKRIVLATYTNILTEQYWRKDLPYALVLFDDKPSTQLLIGRTRYACLAEVENMNPNLFSSLAQSKGLGIESEFRSETKMPSRDFSALWRQVATPSACPGRACPHYQPCFYYKARRAAAEASLVITNHSVVIQDARLKEVTGGEASMLGDYDYLILDEAHDFHSAAQNGLEFEMSEARFRQHGALAMRVFEELLGLARTAGWDSHWRKTLDLVLDTFGYGTQTIQDLYRDHNGRAVAAAMPPELHESLKNLHLPESETRVQSLADAISANLGRFLFAARKIVGPQNSAAPDSQRADADAYVRNYLGYLEDFQRGCELFLYPAGTAVSYVGGSQRDPILRTDIVDLAPVLQDLLWTSMPTTCMSATLALDGDFTFLRKSIGFQPEFEEILPTPFDFPRSMTVYVPRAGKILDPTIARQQDIEAEYYGQIAAELSEVIELLGGRTLALFHSRREMEGVLDRMRLPDSLPILHQGAGSVASIGERFKKKHNASLFALRSFWTGFDAPGETLSCVAVVRIPFEVPVEPLQIARQAWMALNGQDGFQEWTIPTAKMLVRQGVGRLIRKVGDTGMIALLDPRIRTKPYGESFLENLPPGVNQYDDAADAIGALGLDFVSVPTGSP